MHSAPRSSSTLVTGYDGAEGVTSSDTGSVSSELLRTSDVAVLVIPPTAVNHLQEG